MEMIPNKWNAAAVALAECKRVDEVKGWADKAAALAEYARQAQDRHLEIDAGEIRIRAERRLGQLLAEAEKHPGGRPETGPDRGPVLAEDKPKTLKESGISKNLSSRAQKIAAVPDEEFESAVKDWRADTEAARGRVVARLESAGEAALVSGGGKDIPRDLGPSVARESASDEVAELRAMVRELAGQVEALQQDNESMARVFETTDHVSAAMKEAARFRELARVLDGRVKGLQSELHEAQKSASYWKRKYEKGGEK